jgi:hypothetical protein
MIKATRYGRGSVRLKESSSGSTATSRSMAIAAMRVALDGRERVTAVNNKRKGRGERLRLM